MSPLLLALTVSLAAPDAAFDEPDAGLLSRSGAAADVAWVGDGLVKAVWVTPARDLAFQMDRRRARDLWLNERLTDGGLLRPQGAILCPAQPNEFFSSPRIAGNRSTTLVAWKSSLLDRDVIRATEVTASGATSCSRVVHDPGSGVRLGSLQLEESGGNFLLLWESQTHFVTLPLGPSGGGSPNAIIDKSAANLAGLVEPSLAPRVGGFYVAWRQGQAFKGLELTALGVAPGSVTSPFLGVNLASNPVVAGAPVRAVFTDAPTVGTSTITMGNPQLSLLPVNGPELAEPPLLASVEGVSLMDPTLVRTRAFFRTGAEWWMTDFVQQSRALLPSALTPIATAGTFERTALVAASGEERTFVILSGPVSGAEPFSGPVTRTELSQLQASVAWVADAGVFAVGYMEGDALYGAALDPAQAGALSLVTQFSVDAGVTRFHVRPDRDGVALSNSSRAGSTLSLVTGAQPPSSAQLFLSTTAAGLDEAVMGVNVAVLWERGTGRYVWGEGTRGLFPPIDGQVLGRCGALVDDRLLVPVADNDLLKVLVLKDDVTATPELFTLSRDARFLEAPCLAAFGRSIIVVANDASGQLRAWTTTLDEVLVENEAAAVGSLPARPNQRNARNPVATGTAAGWQLAWESTDLVGNFIAQAPLGFDGRVGTVARLSSGLDDRVPLLAASPAGDVVVVWQQYDDALGAVVVRTKGLVRAPVSDAGTPDAGEVRDAGLQVDAGVDAGTPDAGTLDGGAPDAGVQPQLNQFSACGCGPSGDPALVLFGVLLLVARRKASASARA